MASPARVAPQPPSLSLASVAHAVALLADLEALKSEQLIIEYIDEHGVTRFTPALVEQLQELAQ